MDLREAMLINKDFSTNVMSKQEGKFQTTSFDQEKIHIYTYEKFTKNMRNKKQVKIPCELQAGHLNHHLKHPIVEVSMCESLSVTSQNHTLDSGETQTSHSPSKSPHIKQVSS